MQRIKHTTVRVSLYPVLRFQVKMVLTLHADLYKPHQDLEKQRAEQLP